MTAPVALFDARDALLRVTHRSNDARHPLATRRPADGQVEPTPQALSEAAREAWTSGYRRILLAGGEPTLRHDLPRFVVGLRKAGWQTVGLSTNGRLLAYPRAVNQLISAGVSLWSLVIPAHDPAGYDRTTGVPEAAAQVAAGVRNLLKAAARRTELVVAAHLPLALSNRDHLAETARQLLRGGVRRFVLSRGEGGNMDQREAGVAMAPCLELLATEGADVRVVGVPACLLAEWAHLALEVGAPVGERVRPAWSTLVDVPRRGRHTAACEPCPFRNVCAGPPVPRPGVESVDPRGAQVPTAVHGLGDFEHLAVRFGLKPAYRRTVPAGEVAAVLARAEREGLHAAEEERGVQDARGYCWRDDEADAAQRMVLCAKAAETLSALRKLPQWEFGEASTGAEPAARAETSAPALTRRLGGLLGYPRCCTDWFTEHVEETRAEVLTAIAARSSRPGAAAPSWAANVLGLSRAMLLSHFPCAYGCAASVSYAGRLFALGYDRNPASALRMRRLLVGPHLFFRSGYCLRVLGRSDGASVRYFGVEEGQAVPDERTSSDVLRREATARKLLAHGDTVTLTDDRLSVWRGRRALGDAPLGPTDAFFVDFVPDAPGGASNRPGSVH